MAAPQPSGSRSSSSPDGKSLGMGGEAVEHVHAQQQDAPDSGAASQQNAAATGRGDDDGGRGGTDRAGSEPLERTREHVPSYGGMGGEPRVSSDQREPANPSGAAGAPGGQADENDPPYPTPS